LATRTKYFLAIVLLVSGLASLSQNETSKWYFGDQAALNFMPALPVSLPFSPMSQSEGSASMADATGNLLFYTDGMTIWNQASQVMANGLNLMGNTSSSQVLIVPQPGNPGIYFVFTIDADGGPNGFRYSTVDMNLAAGMGSVTAKNVLLYAPASEKLCATKHCNGKDIWVMSHEANNSIFKAYLVTSTGVSTIPVLSNIGSGSAITGGGCMKFSPDGKKLGVAWVIPSGGPGFEIFDFDNATGLVSNSLPIFEGGMLGGYGCEFSPDGTKFYGGASYSAGEIYQWDLCAGSAAAVVASKYTILSTQMGQLQLAKNGKIYISKYTTNTLGVIDSPNLGGPACNFIPVAITLPWPQTCRLGLPNFISNYFEQPPFFTPFTYSVNPVLSCLTASFTAPQASLTTGACTQVITNPVASLLWQFGDPASGAANTSTLNNPVHVYPAAGAYTVQVTLLNACGRTLTTLQQPVLVSTITIGSASTFSMCSGSSLSLTAGGGSANTYSWSNGATGSLVVVSPTATTVYSVTQAGNTACGLGTRTVYVMPLPQPVVPNPVRVCEGQFTLIPGSGADNYIWTSSWSGIVHSGPSLGITISTAANFTVTGVSFYGCTNSTTVEIIPLPKPVLLVTGNETVCPGAAVQLTASGAISYTWSTFSSNWTINTFPGNGSQLSFTPAAGTTTLFVTGVNQFSITTAKMHDCYTTKAIYVVATRSNAITSFSYPPACSNSGSVNPVAADLFSQGGTFSSGALPVDAHTGIADVSTAAPGTYTVKYSVNSDNCTNAGSYTTGLLVSPPETLGISPSVIIGPGDATPLQVSGAIEYSWSPSENLSCIACSNPVASPKESSRYCVKALNHCSSEACVDVIVSCDAKMNYSVPNAFSPNGDGKNDEFCLQGWSVCPSVFNIMIFDRWGEKVFESTDPDFCWDGIYKGRKLVADVFVYVVRSETGSKVVNKKGNITLIR
jgi:gliding motility-associated-like protein